jgi:nicotinamidase-related amidase
MEDLIELLKQHMPVAMENYTAEAGKSGLVIVDEVNGFATVGAGYLAPPADSPQVTQMIRETDRLARGFSEKGMPGKPEPPYPPHCESGTGEENLVAEIEWLETDPNATLVRKDCINGFIGAFAPDGSNRVVNWVAGHNIEELLVVGICTDICVMDFVLTTLSARNHDMMPSLSEIFVYDAGCSTYDLPRDTAEKLGYGATAAHPQDATHYMGLYFMASRGARLVDEVSV